MGGCEGGGSVRMQGCTTSLGEDGGRRQDAMSPLERRYGGGGCDLPGTVTLRLPWVFADSGPRKCSPHSL